LRIEGLFKEKFKKNLKFVNENVKKPKKEVFNRLKKKSWCLAKFYDLNNLLNLFGREKELTENKLNV
jgi:hypothetical protein